MGNPDYYEGGSSYFGFLQAQTTVTQISGEVTSGIREMIATKEQLNRYHVALMKSAKDGFEVLSYDSRHTGYALVSVNESLKQGFAEIVSSLDELKQIGRSPSFTWAMEQYVVAKQAFLADCHEEAFTHIGWALNGNANNGGFDLDFRFHFLHGLIRMGTLKQPVESIVNLAAAETAFLLSAKYAESRTQAVAMGFRCAGWAAYCQGNLEDAIAYSRKAVQYDPKLAEAHFQLAKVYVRMGRSEEAARPLRNAICLDFVYAVKSAIDPDFQRDQDALGNIFGSIRTELREESERFDSRFALAERRYKVMTQCNKVLTIPFRVSSKEQDQLESTWNLREEAKAQADSNTIFGHSLAISFSRNADGLHWLVESLRRRAFEAFRQSMEPLYEILNSRRTEIDLYEVVRGFRVWILIFGYAPWMFFWIYVTPAKMSQFVSGGFAIVAWAVIVYAGLPIACSFLECLWLVPRLILNALWEQTIGMPARRRLKKLETLKDGLDSAFA
jgi:tetratricopeptide (TPR) repeat protein